MAQPLDREALARIAAFAALFDAPDFSFGEWEPSRRQADGVMTMPCYVLSPAADEFRRVLIVDPSVDWPVWAQTPEAQWLKYPASVADATPEQLVKLMTWIVRSDRFVEGSLEGAYESGLLRAIIARATVLSRVKEARSE